MGGKGKERYGEEGRGGERRQVAEEWKGRPNQGHTAREMRCDQISEREGTKTNQKKERRGGGGGGGGKSGMKNEIKIRMSR